MKGIPRDLTREDILAALEELSAGRRTRWRSSRKYVLLHDDRRYSPKEVLGLAVCLVEGVDEQLVGRFSGGAQTNDILRRLGFEVIEKVTDSGNP